MKNIFTKRQESELITAIKGRGEVPLKFAYLGDGAKNWDAVARGRTEGGGINSTEGEMLKKKGGVFLDSLDNTKSINVIDIGCGNGFPVFPVLEELVSRKVPFKYVPIDISQELLDLAEKNVLEHFPNTPIEKNLLDFELGNFSDITYQLKENGSANLLLFLGSTLGNHSDRTRVLTNFRDSMTSEDFLIIGVEATNLSQINKILGHYSGGVVDDFVLFVPEQIGLKKGDVDLNASWNDSLSQVEVRATLKKDVSVKIGNDEFVLEKDEVLLLGRSVKFTEFTMTKILSDVNFRNEILTTNQGRSYVLAMVQPTRYST